MSGDDHWVSFQINDDGSIAMPFAEGKVVYADHFGLLKIWIGTLFGDSQECVSTAIDAWRLE